MLLLPQLFRPTDLYEGAVLRFHHCPDQRFEVLRVDNSASGLSDEMVDEKPTVTELDMLLARVAWRLDGRVASVVKTLEGYDWRVQGACLLWWPVARWRHHRRCTEHAHTIAQSCTHVSMVPR